MTAVHLQAGHILSFKPMPKKTQNQSEKPLEETQHAAKPQQHRGKGPDRRVVTLPADRSPEEGEHAQIKDVQGYTLGRRERRNKTRRQKRSQANTVFQKKLTSEGGHYPEERLTRSRENTSIVDCEETAETWTPFDGKPITGYGHSSNTVVFEAYRSRTSKKRNPKGRTIGMGGLGGMIRSPV